MSPDRARLINALRPGNTVALFLVVLLVIQTGSWLGHWLFHGSRALADVTASKFINVPVNWLAGLAIKWDYPVFHRLGILLAATAGVLPFSRLLIPSSRKIMASASGSLPFHESLRRCLLCMGYSSLIAVLISLFTGRISYEPGINHFQVYFAFWAMRFLLCFLIAIPIEFLFRGLFLRVITSDRPSRVTCFVSSTLCLWAFVSFMPISIESWNPQLSSESFPLWQFTARHFLWPEVWYLTAPVFLISMICWWMQYKYSCLWLAVGVQGGFLLSIALSGTPFSALACATTGCYFSTLTLRRKARKR